MCMGCTGITIGEGFFQIVGKRGHNFGYSVRLDSGHIVHFIFCATKSCTQKLLFLFIS